MKNDLRYVPSDIFQTFPFPKNTNEVRNNQLEQIGDAYHSFRKKLMLKEQEGLTTTYNRFHNPEESNPDHIRLRELHQQMDEAVLWAYGWEDLIEKEYPLSDDKFRGTSLHGFYEVDYLPENDRIRFTLHPAARKEVLKRLLLLNHEIYEQEIRQGLHKKKDAEAFYQQKGQEMPDEVKVLYEKGKGQKKKSSPNPVAKATAKVEEPKANYSLFKEGEVATATKKEVGLFSRVTLINHTQGKTFKFYIVKDSKNGQIELEHQPIAITSQLALSMLNRKPGSTFTFNGEKYEIKEVE